MYVGYFISLFCSCVIFKEPNPEDPLNKEAAEVLQTNRRLFETNVQKSMRGGYVGSVS
jgi:ubiquitin-conjugating enzyme E2 M